MKATKLYDIENYVHVFQTDLDTKTLRKSCLAMAQFAVRTWGNLGGMYADENSPESTKIYNHYNAFLHPYDEFSSAYVAVCDAFSQIKPKHNDDQYWMQVWVNVYQKGDFVNWHEHWTRTLNAHHGFICVNCGESKTTYAITNEDTKTAHEHDVASEDGLLVISKSSHDRHRTYPWNSNENPRITIAFDIIPAWAVQSLNSENHWIPMI